MRNSKNILQFNHVFSQYINANVSILNSLMLISQMKSVSKKVKKAAMELHQRLEEGTQFSTAIRHCEEISFPKSYAAFLEIAQETGRLNETIEYLEQTQIRKNEIKNEFITISIYPLFIIIMSFSLSIILYKYSSCFAMTSSADNSVFIRSAVFLLTSIFLYFVIMKKIFSENILLNLINALSFLTSSGIDIKTSLEISINVVEEKRSVERNILNAIDSLERGFSVADAVSFLSKKNRYVFEIENTCGNISRSFKNLLKLENARRNETLKRVKNLCEPIMILIVSVYILIIAKGLVMPLLFDYTNFI